MPMRTPELSSNQGSHSVIDRGVHDGVDFLDVGVLPGAGLFSDGVDHMGTDAQAVARPLKPTEPKGCPAEQELEALEIGGLMHVTKPVDVGRVALNEGKDIATMPDNLGDASESIAVQLEPIRPELAAGVLFGRHSDYVRARPYRR